MNSLYFPDNNKKNASFKIVFFNTNLHGNLPIQ